MSQQMKILLSAFVTLVVIAGSAAIGHAVQFGYPTVQQSVQRSHPGWRVECTDRHSATEYEVQCLSAK